MRSSRRDRTRPQPPDDGASRTPPTQVEAAPDEECSVSDGLRKLVQLLPQVTRGLRRRPESPEQLDHLGLGPRHGSALSLLNEDGVLTVGQLAGKLDLTPATVSGVVADLERVGFVERWPDPADRRRTIVRIPPGNLEAVDAWLEGAAAPIVRALDKLSAEERATFVKAMQYLEAELNRGPDPGGKGGPPKVQGGHLRS
jgi:DNA-binding MarR family transcriptional regulator